MPKITRPSRRWLTILAVLLIIFIAGGAYLYQTWHNPLGPKLTLGEAPEGEPAVFYTEAGGPAANATVSGTGSEKEPVCGGPPAMLILVAGVDGQNRADGPADAIRLVRLDFLEKKIALLALSPDLWVDIPAISDHGITQGRLTQAYLFGTEKTGFYEGEGQGPELLARTLYRNFGLRPEHYIAIDLKAFEDLVNEVGGIEVTLPRDLQIRFAGEPGMDLEAGHHHLNGREAAMVVRARTNADDYPRIDNQITVFKALAAKILNSADLRKLPDLANLFLDRVTTSLSPAEINKLKCLVRQIDPETDLTYLNLPKEFLNGKKVSDQYLEKEVQAYTWDKNSTRRFLSGFQNGKLAE